MKKNSGFTVGIIIIVILLCGFIVNFISSPDSVFNSSKRLHILSSPENEEVMESLREYASREKIFFDVTYKGDLEIVDELNANSEEYDAVWISNSTWLYNLNNSYLTSESSSISISPVVMGIKMKKAKELGLVGRNVSNTDLLELISNKKINYVMSSVTKTNTGATAYLGFLNALAGSPEVLTEDMLDNDVLIDKMVKFFSGVERVSGDEKYLENMFIKGSDYEAIIASESSLININKSLKGDDKLYLLYPYDGVPINDSTLAFIANDPNKKDGFLKLKNYLLSEDGQKLLQESGRRTWYGGVNNNSLENVFDKNYGIDTSKYLVTSKYPSKVVMTKAINLYIEALRKPTHVVFCLDYSGSMYGNGYNQLTDAMNYILEYEQASKDQLQFTKKDKISLVLYASNIMDKGTSTGDNTSELIEMVNRNKPTTSTAMYLALEEAIKILDYPTEDYTKTIIVMTDGESNVGSYSSFENFYLKNKSNIPVYGIMFGNANAKQLNKVALLTNGKVFDGRTNLLNAFKEVRGYN